MTFIRTACLQFIFRYEVGDAYLGAVSRFMTNAFEYGDALLPQNNQDGDAAADTTSPVPIASNQPYLNLATSVPFLLNLPTV